MISINPTDEIIDRDLEKCDSVLFFHNIESKFEFEKVKDRVIDLRKNDVVYIHYYSKTKEYTVGIKRRD